MTRKVTYFIPHTLNPETASTVRDDEKSDLFHSVHSQPENCINRSWWREEWPILFRTLSTRKLHQPFVMTRRVTYFIPHTLNLKTDQLFVTSRVTNFIPHTLNPKTDQLFVTSRVTYFIPHTLNPKTDQLFVVTRRVTYFIPRTLNTETASTVRDDEKSDLFYFASPHGILRWPHLMQWKSWEDLEKMKSNGQEDRN